MRFLAHYPCGNGRKKPHGKHGGWGLVAVQGSLPAAGDPGDTGHSAGAAPVSRGRKSSPSTSLSSLRDQDGLPTPIQVCIPLRVRISHGRNGAERHGSSSWTGCASPGRIWRSFAGINETLVCPIRTLGSSLLLPAWGNRVAGKPWGGCEPHLASPAVGQGFFGGSKDLMSF